MDYMRHKAALAVEVHFLRRMSLALTASVYDRNGSTRTIRAGRSVLSEVRDYEPYFLLDGRLQWEKGICRLYVDATNITDSPLLRPGRHPPARGVGHGGRGADHRPLIRSLPRFPSGAPPRGGFFCRLAASRAQRFFGLLAGRAAVFEGIPVYFLWLWAFLRRALPPQ